MGAASIRKRSASGLTIRRAALRAARWTLRRVALMLELPEFQILKKQPRVPHVARVVAKRDWPNEHGAPITYIVQQARNGREWWLSASLNGLRMSDTLHTAKAEKAAEWVRAVEIGQVCMGC